MTRVRRRRSPVVDELPAVLAAAPAVALGGQVRAGVAWTAGSRVLVQLLQVGGTAVLARLLAPADYGLSALVAVVTGFAAILVDMGVASSVIQRRDLTARYLDTAFWLNFGVGVVMAGLVCAVAYPVAAFFDQPQLVGLMLISSLTLLLSLNAVHVSVLRRALAFDRISRMNLTSSLIGILTSIIAAMLGMGAVSLVLGPVAQRVMSVIQLWVAVRWLPRRRWSGEDARDIWRFGRGLTGSNILTYWVSSLDRILIGRVITVADLGYYNRATNLMQLPLQQTTQTLATVFYPALSAMAGDPDRMQRAWLRLVRAAWMIGLPSGIGLALTSSELVPVLYGSRWEMVIPLLAVLSLGVPFQVLGMAAGPAYLALGKTGLQFRLGLITAVVSVGALAVGIHWGVMGIVVAVVLRAAFTTILTMLVLLWVMGVRFRQLGAVLWRSLAGTAVMAAGVFAVPRTVGPLPDGGLLAIEVGVGLILYGAMTWWLERDTVRGLLGRGAKKKRPGPAPGGTQGPGPDGAVA